MGFLLRQCRRLWGELKAKIQRKEGKCVHLGWRATKHKLHHTRVAESTEWAKCTRACELDFPPPRMSSTYHARVTFALAFRVLPKFGDTLGVIPATLPWQESSKIICNFCFRELKSWTWMTYWLSLIAICRSSLRLMPRPIPTATVRTPRA